jgi:hypothetical protein
MAAFSAEEFWREVALPVDPRVPAAGLLEDRTLAGYRRANTERIAAKHYLQATDDYFTAAAERGTESATRAAQNAAQQPAATVRNNPRQLAQVYGDKAVSSDSAEIAGEANTPGGSRIMLRKRWKNRMI